MNNKEKRKDIRVDLSDPCFVMIKDDLFEVYNISNNGLFLKCDVSKFKIGERLLVEIMLPDNLGNMFVESEVIRTKWHDKEKNNIGIGLQFINFKSKTLLIIKSYVTYLRNKQIVKVAKMIIENYLGNNNDKYR